MNMLRKKYKNYLNIHPTPDPIERRMNITKEALHKGTPLPKPVVYEDIDEAFKKWVEEDLMISFEGKRLPTMTLFSNQRFSEYLQSWQFLDENNNVLLNFKTVNRENNPQQGSQYAKNYNIPGDRFYLMSREVATDEAGRKYFIDYKMKQPFNVDLVYRINIVASRLELLNEFNLMVLDKFKSKQVYIAPNGYYMSMVLDSISDESKYSVDDRQFFNQSFSITLRGYIIKEDDMRVEENPLLSLHFTGDEDKKTRPLVSLVPDIDECPDSGETDDRYYETLRLDFDICQDDFITFNTKKNNIVIYFYEVENIQWFEMSVDGGEWVKYLPECPEDFSISAPEYTVIKLKIKRDRILSPSAVIFSAFDRNKTMKIDDDGIREFRPETEEDNNPIEIVKED